MPLRTSYKKGELTKNATTQLGGAAGQLLRQGGVLAVAPPDGGALTSSLRASIDICGRETEK